MATLNLSEITFQSLFFQPMATVPLTGGQVPLLNTSLLEISLSQADLDILKLSSMVCTYRGNCYISFTADLVEDMNANAAVAVEDTFPGFLVVEYLRDTIAPELLNFDLDLAIGTLTLEFNEPIDLESIQYERIVFQGVQNISNETDIETFPLSEPQNMTPTPPSLLSFQVLSQMWHSIPMMSLKFLPRMLFL